MGSCALGLKTDQQGWMASRPGGPAPQGDPEVGAQCTPARITEDPGLRHGWLRSPEALL